MTHSLTMEDLPVNLADRLELSPEVVAREVGGETMLLDLASGTYFGLDEVGGMVWQAIEEGQPLSDACDRIESAFDASREQVEADVLALAAQLVEQGLASAS